MNVLLNTFAHCCVDAFSTVVQCFNHRGAGLLNQGVRNSS